MRFISYTGPAGNGVGLLTTAGYRGLPVSELGFALRDVIGKGTDAVVEFGARLSEAPLLAPGSFRLLPPIPDPDKILCIGLNYRKHAAESNTPVPEYPVVFSRYHSSLVGADAPLIRPNVSDLLDYEVELAAVIGKSGRNIPVEQALEHVAGYSVFNDASVRDYQVRTQQWFMGKNFDGTGAFGPELVTADELPPGAKGLHLEAPVNGQVLQSDNTEDLIFDVATLVHVISEAMTLSPGDVIVTGTPSGVGARQNPPIWLKPGDMCEVEIVGIGLLSNPVEQERSEA